MLKGLGTLDYTGLRIASVSHVSTMFMNLLHSALLHQFVLRGSRTKWILVRFSKNICELHYKLTDLKLSVCLTTFFGSYKLRLRSHTDYFRPAKLYLLAVRYFTYNNILHNLQVLQVTFKCSLYVLVTNYLKIERELIFLMSLPLLLFCGDFRGEISKVTFVKTSTDFKKELLSQYIISK